ncbi:hypothetical protein SXIM_28220 [Streptomyces xiamenensis]|uniref:DUF1330 domain-containing protein n=1 Tax=Streptomyces xiamenensis TaxID=408015 RepID=A0A0F7CP82_9ACTN|nr:MULTISPECIES: hypothetical protein [Streptomyces]AKG44206.1 hypothetical protein SXIM_28220 [Streptomyces xiamenensis]
MSAPLLLVTEVPVLTDAVDKAAETWSAHPTAPGSALFRSLDGEGLLVELTPLTGTDDIAEHADAHRAAADALAPLLAGDFRRQVVAFVEAPKDTDDPLPATPYLQLRHVEVKPPVYDGYRAWRERTIFEVVREHAEVEVFLAYHSLLSTEPGVLFVSGFSVEPDTYQAVFTSPAYQEIVRQAGDTYITDRGLYTRIYARVTA